MVVKKYYCVKKGKITGVFCALKECKNSVDGYSDAEYKEVATIEEAREYLGELFCMRGKTEDDCVETYYIDEVCVEDNCVETNCMDEVCAEGGCVDRIEGVPAKEGHVEAVSQSASAQRMRDFPDEEELLAYVDGSYDNSLKKYAFGCVFLLPDGRIYTKYGNGNNEKSLRHRNVTGEMLGAMYAVKFAMLNGFKGIEICYDYGGIEKWVTGEWRSKTELTAKYAASMREWGRDIRIRFTKVIAHTNVFYNELADKMAKKGLKEGNGVPKISLIEDMEEYDGTDEIK